MGDAAVAAPLTADRVRATRGQSGDARPKEEVDGLDRVIPSTREAATISSTARPPAAPPWGAGRRPDSVDPRHATVAAALPAHLVRAVHAEAEVAQQRIGGKDA